MTIHKDELLELRKKYGEAFYLLDSKQFRKNFLELKEAFGKNYTNFNIAYSYKTNYIPKVCKIVKEFGGYAEVVSEMELELALKIGNSPQKIIWNGPIKNQDVMRKFILSGGTVNIDSIDEILFIERIAKENKTINLSVGVRCNYDVGDGVVSRFGLDVDGRDFYKVLEIIANNTNIRLKNYHCHFAKRQIDYWPARAKGMLDVITKTGIVPDRIDIGGGLFGKMPISLKEQFSSEIPNYNMYAESVAGLFVEYFKDSEKKPELLIEPGSALVGDCMKFVGTIKTIKNIRGKYFASVLGSQKNISMTGVNPPIEVIHMSNGAKEYENIDFVGFTCIEGDVLYRNYKGKVDVNDMIVIGNCGSYSVVMKPPFILPNFPIVDISEGNIEIIKQGETFDDIFRTFIL